MPGDSPCPNPTSSPEALTLLIWATCQNVSGDRWDANDPHLDPDTIGRQLGPCPWLFDLRGTVRAMLVSACHQNKQDKLRLGLSPIIIILESLTSLVALGE